MEFGNRGIGGEIKLFPPPVYRGDLEKWEDVGRLVVAATEAICNCRTAQAAGQIAGGRC